MHIIAPDQLDTLYENRSATYLQPKTEDDLGQLTHPQEEQEQLPPAQTLYTVPHNLPEDRR